MKNFFRILIGIIIGFLFTLAGVFFYGRMTENRDISAPPLPLGQAAVITHLAGPVFIIRDEETVDAYPGYQLKAGDVLKVTDGAMAQVQMAEKGSALLGSDTLVHFMKLVGASQQLELRTEILTGSLSYKVEKLNDNESIIIEANGTEYAVTGTEFFIRKSQDVVTLAVGHGRVEARGEQIAGELAVVEARRQLVVGIDASAETKEMTAENKEYLDSNQPLPVMAFGYPEALVPVRVEIHTEPPDAIIYIDGMLTGVGRFQSLLPKGTVIEVRIRRRGFKDYSMTVKADSDQIITMKMEPADIKATLAEKKDAPSLLERIREDYERRLTELQNQIIENEARNKTIRNAEISAKARLETQSIAQLEMERAQRKILEAELAEIRRENETLQGLIGQIQELTE